MVVKREENEVGVCVCICFHLWVCRRHFPAAFRPVSSDDALQDGYR